MDNFTLESYGVPVRVECCDPQLLQQARSRAEEALVGNFQLIESDDTPHVYRLGREDLTYVLIKDGRTIRHGESETLFLKYFDSMLRITVAEYAVGRVFVHAGVVAWRGKGIVIPGDSFSGKTTLVAELVKCGAEYFSDEYAVFDENGLVHPFARRLAMRGRPVGKDPIDVEYVTAEELGGTAAVAPVSVRWILLTEFREDAEWKPQLLSPGRGTLEMLSQTIPIRYAPAFSFKVLKKVTASAIIIRNSRFDAERFAQFFLNFVDRKSILG